MFLVFLLVLFIHMYLQMHIIDQRSAGRCGNHGSPSEPRSEIHMSLQRFTSRERSHSFPHREATATWLLLLNPSLSPLCLVRHLSYKPNAWISFTDSNVAVCPELNLNFTLPNTNHPFAPSIRHVRRASPYHCLPLFPFLTWTS
ncbi:hypothetical protein BJV78DRAFT_847405 [Lactifluus subvellereus]|nr:hypothetical protein BJV78DRAFT_847405 [Lactifluus subvellereus]